MKKYVLPAMAVIALAALAGCGGSNHDDTPAPVANDAFFTLVNTQYMGLSDTAEPDAIDAVAVTSPENTEPVAL